MPSGEYEIVVFAYHWLTNSESNKRNAGDVEFSLSIRLDHSDKMMIGNKFFYISLDS